MNRLNNSFALRLLRFFCPEHLYEEIEGDLIQRFAKDTKVVGERNARRKLIWNAIKFFRPGILLRNRFSIELNGLYMIKNYFVTAVRFFQRQKVYSFINVLGLSVGLAASFLIFIYIQDELSYDRFFNESDKIYRVGITEKFQDKEISYTETSSPLAAVMREEIPEVISSTRVGRWPNQLISNDGESFVEKRFLLADSSFFRVFNYKFIEGNPGKCLTGPNKIVITKSTALKYFGYKGNGDTSPIGKFLYFDKSNAIEVTGIIDDMPANTHMKFDLLLSMETWPYVANDDCWACYNLHTYFKISDTRFLPAVEEKLKHYVDANVFPRVEKETHVTKKQMLARGDRINFFIQPLTSIHLESHFDGEWEPNGDLRYVKLFGAIAIFIVLIACVNFMNLATARAVNRAKEIGVRKTLGAFKIYLVEQFLFESFLYAVISAVVAGLLVVVLLEPFNTLTGKRLDFTALQSPLMWLGVILFVVVLGLLAGSYPAFYLTAFKPIEVLKGKLQTVRNYNVRNGLVVFQFGISIALIICTLVIYRQLNFIQQFNLGFDKESIVRVNQTWILENKTDAFRNELLKHKEFLQASYALQLPPYITNDCFVRTEGSDQVYSSFFTTVDPDQMATFGYKLKNGRFFSREFPSDTSSVVINESCARLLGIDDLEEKFISTGGKRKFKVIGVTEDFHFESVRHEIKPLILFLNHSRSVMALRVAKGDVSEKIKLAESIWKQFVTESPFQYSFIDEDYTSMFNAEQQMGKVFLTFTCMAIFIACLGLFGLITFMTHQRTKEIGIRKVMGASNSQIAFLLSRSFLWLVIISFFIAVPFTWYGVNQWLQSFAYHTDFDVRIILVSGLAAMIMVILTVSYKSFAAASKNPVESLKNE